MSAIGRDRRNYPPTQNGKEKRPGLVTLADWLRFDGVADIGWTAADKAKLDSSAPRAGVAFAVRAYNSASLAIASATPTHLTFDTNRAIQAYAGVLHSTSANTDRFVAEEPGWWRMTAHVVFAASTAGSYRLVRVKRSNGALIAEVSVNPPTTGNTAVITITALDRYAAGEYAVVEVQHDAGAPLNVALTPNRSPEVTWEFAGNDDTV